jgi:hypothetical protein
MHINRRMDKENVVYTHSRMLFSYGKDLSYVICRKMGGTGDHKVK